MKTTVSPMLSVRNGAKAVDFYAVAFGAIIMFRIDAPDGSVVAQLLPGRSGILGRRRVPGAPELQSRDPQWWYCPHDPHSRRPRCSLQSSGRRRSHYHSPRCRSIRLAPGPSRRSLRTPLGDRQTLTQSLLNHKQQIKFRALLRAFAKIGTQPARNYRRLEEEPPNSDPSTPRMIWRPTELPIALAALLAIA